jgi:putative ABC transport system substrate-binding protein
VRLAVAREGLDDDHAAAATWTGGRGSDRLSSLAAELVRRPVVVIVTSGGTAPALVAKAATSTIPILFTTGSDPVRDGLVASLNRPGRNVTGVVFIVSALGAKRLELLRQLVPNAATTAMLVHPDTHETEAERSEVQTAAKAIGRQLIILDARVVRDIETAFETLVARRADALLVRDGHVLPQQSGSMVALAARFGIPAIYAQRESVIAGGLMSYGSSISDAYRQAGLYVARILKGEKPADLPVMQSTKFEFVLNLKTDRLLVPADEAIE